MSQTNKIKSLCRQRPSLKSILKQSNRFKREEFLEHANANQINAVCEMALNLLKNRILVKLKDIMMCCGSWISAKILTEDVMMVGTSEFERLADYYKGQSTESVLLNIAGRLAAQQHLILKNPKIPNATAVKMAKPMAQDQG